MNWNGYQNPCSLFPVLPWHGLKKPQSCLDMVSQLGFKPLHTSQIQLAVK